MEMLRSKTNSSVQPAPLSRAPSSQAPRNSMSGKEAWVDEGEDGLPDGKEFNYFLCHKKLHTRFSGEPGQLAENLHDSLELLGFRGFFDIDTLTEISKEAMAANLEKTLTVVLLLNDETLLSPWCCHEIETAGKLGLPIQVVVDMERCDKQKALQSVQQAGYKQCLQFQWIDLTTRHRRQCLAQVCDFLRQQAEAATIKSAAAEDAREMLTSAAHAMMHHTTLRVGQQRLLHPRFEMVLTIGGIPLTPARGRLKIALIFWTYLLRGIRFVALMTLIADAIYARGPLHTDRHSTVSLATILLCITLLEISMRRIFRSNDLASSLRRMDGAASREFADRLYRQTKLLANGTIILGVGIVPVAYVAILPLAFHSDYTASEDMGERFYGYFFGGTFVVWAALLPITAVPIIAQAYLVLSIASIRTLCSVDCLHKQIRTLGFDGWVRTSDCRLALTTSALVDFCGQFNAGLRDYHHLTSRMWLFAWVVPPTMLVMLSTPVTLLLDGWYFDMRTLHWAHILRHMALSGIGMIVALLVSTIPLYITIIMRRLRNRLQIITCEDPVHRLYLLSVFERAEMDCSFGGIVFTPMFSMVTMAFAGLLSAAWLPIAGCSIVVGTENRTQEALQAVIDESRWCFYA